MKTRLISLLVTAIAVIALLPAPSAQANDRPFEGVTLNFFNWGYFSNPELIQQFERETGITVNYSRYNSNEELFTRLMTGGTHYDIMIPSDYMVAQLINTVNSNGDLGMLRPLNWDNIPNIQYVDDFFRNQNFDPHNRYSVPYAWGVTGIVYNTNYVETPTSWNALWDEQHRGRILMFNNSRDAFGVAALLLGHDINDLSEDTLAAQSELLRSQRSLVRQYVMDEIYVMMPGRQAHLAPWYVGSFFYMHYNNNDLNFAKDLEEGVNFFLNNMVIPYNSRNPEAAEAFINFFTSPEISGRNMAFVGYSTPIYEARAWIAYDTETNPYGLPPEHMALAYPSYEWLSANALPHMFQFRTIEEVNNLNNEWRRLRAGRDNLLIYWIGVPAVIILLAAGYIIMKQRKKKRDAAIDED